MAIPKIILQKSVSKSLTQAFVSESKQSATQSVAKLLQTVHQLKQITVDEMVDFHFTVLSTVFSNFNGEDFKQL